MKRYVTGFMFSLDRKCVSLIKKNNPEWQRGRFNGVGGKIEAGESPALAMSREFKEETAVVTSPDDWTFFLTLTDQKSYEVNMLFCFSDKVFSVVSAELEEVKIFKVDELPKNIISNLSWLIPLALDKSVQHNTHIKIRSKEKC